MSGSTRTAYWLLGESPRGWGSGVVGNGNVWEMQCAVRRALRKANR